MADYDNTDKGAAFKPFDKQKLILQGKINDGGREKKIVLIKDETKSGDQVIEIFEKIGTLFPSKDKKVENAPDYSGPLNQRRIAAWKRMKDENPYMTFAVSDQRTDSAPKEDRFKDDIPF